MRKITALLNLFSTFAVLWALYTGLDTITHKANDPIFHGFVAFIAIFISAISSANSMLYINTLHKEIDELNLKLKNNIIEQEKELSKEA